MAFDSANAMTQLTNKIHLDTFTNAYNEWDPYYVGSFDTFIDP